MGMIVQLLGGALAIASPFLAVGAAAVGLLAHLRAKKENRPFMTMLGEMLRRAGDDRSRGRRSGLNPWVIVGLRVGVFIAFVFIVDHLFSNFEKAALNILKAPSASQKASQPPPR